MGCHLPEVTVVADVVSDPVLVNVGVLLGFAREPLGDLKGLEDGATVIFTTTEVVNLSDAWCLNKGGHEAGDIERVDVIADLFPLVAEDAVFLPLEVALHKVTKESMELDSGVVRPGEAASAQTAGGHIEVASVFLDDDVGGDLGGSEEGVLALIDGEVLGDAVRIGGICIIPAGIEFLERDGIGAVTVDLIRRHVDEGGLGAGSAGGLEHVEGADGIGIEVVEGDRRSAVVAGLSGSVDDGVGLYLSNQIEDALAVADIEFVMDKALQVFLEALLVPAGVALRAEEDGALIVINSMDLVAEFTREVVTNLRADQA